MSRSQLRPRRSCLPSDLDQSPLKSQIRWDECKNACRSSLASEGHLRVEPMFDTKTSFAGRLADAVDLLLDFATLGEYGLEPVGRPVPSCQTRHRPRSAQP